MINTSIARDLGAVPKAFLSLVERLDATSKRCYRKLGGAYTLSPGGSSMDSKDVTVTRFYWPPECVKITAVYLGSLENMV